MITEHNVPQGSPEWLELRQGKVTGTSLGDICKAGKGKARPATWNTLMFKLLADMTCQRIHDELTSSAVMHGVETEDMARSQASKAKHLDFETVGFLTNDDIPGFGISPDAVTRNLDEDIIGGLEIKCPNSEMHIRWMFDKCVPKEHWHQVLAPFVLSDQIEFWYFMSFDYRNYNKPEFYIEVRRENVVDEIRECREKLSDFITQLDNKYAELCFG